VLFIDALVALSLEGLGLNRLERCLKGIDQAAAQRALQVLALADQHGSDPRLAIELDRKFGLSITPVYAKPWVLFQHLYPQSQVRRTEAAFTGKILNVTRQRRQLLLQVAAQACRLESGNSPERASDPVPRYLPQLPRDPQSDQPLSLR
jgi:hypothetical protein